MKEKKDIKWVSLQPLTGGMYLGFEEAIGHPAEFIISYKGLNDNHPRKDGSRGHCGNEYNLTNYLRKKGRNVPRYEFQHGMFDMETNWRILPDSYTDIEFPNFEGIDIVCAVPVCSGLSALTTTDSCDKDRKNCNMKFLAKFAIEVLNPTVYVFENAPGFMSAKGDEIRKWFEDFAWEHHYSIAYFKTDTVLHHNCQRRPRTFVALVKDVTNTQNTQNTQNTHLRTPELDNIWENDTLSIKDVLSAIPEDATYQDSLPIDLYENVTTIEYAKEMFDSSWRDMFQGDIVNKIIRGHMLEDFERWCLATDKVDKKFADRMVKHIEHIKKCMSEDKGWWSATPRYYPEKMAAVQSRTIYATIHPTETRLCSERDMLTFMGMPYDFEMQGAFMSDGPKIGQNVPVKTAKWMAEIAVKYVNTVSTEPADDPHTSPRFYDNTKQEIVR